MTREEKQKAIDALKISAPIMAVTQEEFKDYIQSLNKIMDWLEQEPTDKIFTKAELDSIVKAINEGWELRVNEVIDKIRAEIETKYGRCTLVEYFVQYDGVCTGRNDIGDIADILQIIDKYKAAQESEEKA